MPKTPARAAKPAKQKAKAAPKAAPFKLTYATMYNPPESMHTKYDRALAAVKATFGTDYGMLINNQEVYAEAKFDDRSPINTDWVLGTFQKGTSAHADLALSAAHAAWPKWAALKWQDRVRLLRRGAAQIEKRVSAFYDRYFSADPSWFDVSDAIHRPDRFATIPCSKS